MLLAIDVGNTHTVFGAHDGQGWRSVWRLHTSVERTEDEYGASLMSLLERDGLKGSIKRIVIASVVPGLQETLERLADKWFHCAPLFVTYQLDLGLSVKYDPPSAVGADRLANAVAAMEGYGLPVIVVDLGTATTLDTVTVDKEYIGGAILPGVSISMEALFQRAARLPKISLDPPETAIGRDTLNSLRAGIVIGTAGAIDTLVERFKAELKGTPRVIATGGLAESVIKASKTIEKTDLMLTLEGLRLIAERNP